MATAGLGSISPAGPTIQALPDAPRWTQRADIPDAGIESLTRLLTVVKMRLRPGEDVTQTEFEKFVAKIFNGWATGQPHRHPRALSGRKEVTYEFGTLAETLIASSSESGKGKPRQRGSSHIWKANAPRTKHPHRQRGQPVLLSMGYRPSHGFWFDFRDKRGGLMSMGAAVRHNDSEEDSLYYAMNEHDDFQYNEIHQHNVDIAIYMARNRLQYWANGEGVPGMDLPFDQPCNVLSQIHMLRHESMIPWMPAASLRRLKELPEYELFKDC